MALLPDFYADLGALVRNARTSKGMTQGDLAKEIQLSRTSVTNIEAGRQPVMVHQLSEIARVLSVSIAELTPDLNAASLRPSVEAVSARVRPNHLAWVHRVIGEARK